MCVIVNHTEHYQKAKDAITCYKIVRVDEQGNILSEIENFVYEIEKTYTTDLKRLSSTKMGAGFNSFASYSGVKKLKDFYNEFCNNIKANSFKIAKCEIPVGSKYIIGIENLPCKQVANAIVSESIIIKEIEENV